MPPVHINGKWLGQPFTGVQRYSEELARHVVADRGIDFVLHVPKGARVPDWALAPNVTVRRAPLAGLAFEQLYLPVATAGRVLLSFGGMAPLAKRRQIVTFHDANPFRFPQTYRRTFVAFYLVAYLLLVRTARRVLTVSEFSKSELAQVLRVKPSRFLVVGCAADSLTQVSARQPDLPWHPQTYLLVGTLARHKNVPQPTAALAGSGRHVVVVGAGGDAHVYSSAGADLSDNVVVAQRLTDGELRWLYENAAALVFPSFYEGFGLPVLEAQALGCPVIASNRASIPEVGGDGALYFDPENVTELLQHAHTLESDSSAADKLVDLGRRNASRYTWTTSANRVLAAIRSMVV
ncbi:glycosyl transferase family 1 [Mycolicibacterium anyangense]|uniref:Glycosyl transferase family 1 n=1 Tax=Mycolicibacterium anyangense TaxID=1431246 RepID=A0A6N4WCT8_9MYCO|nr:glycosyltransferase family 1 protein [Mycolicibacterium anyangense]BBZ79846.1 glycosyl transferase family 1 [Mycolicibacterium anyangense]